MEREEIPCAIDPMRPCNCKNGRFYSDFILRNTQYQDIGQAREFIRDEFSKLSEKAQAIRITGMMIAMGFGSEPYKACDYTEKSLPEE